MMSSLRIYQCSECKISYSVSSKDIDIHLLSKDVACPLHPCEGKIRFLAKTNARIKTVRIKAIELYQAPRMGFLHERKCGPSEVNKLLKNAVITNVDIDKTKDPTKSILRSITLKGGKTIHLAPSTQGVVVLKITGDRNVRR